MKAEARRVAPHDRVFLYTTRLCFQNPTRDRGRVIGLAVVTKPSRRLAEAVTFGGREYVIELALPHRATRPIPTRRSAGRPVPQLDLPRQGLMERPYATSACPVGPGDGDVLLTHLAQVAEPYRAALDSYAQRLRPESSTSPYQ